MAKVNPRLWRDLLGYLRQQHGPICRQWFEELRPQDLDHGLLQIRTTNGVQQRYLQHHCLEPFTEAAQTVTGALVAVRFVCPGQPPAPGSPSTTPLTTTQPAAHPTTSTLRNHSTEPHAAPPPINPDPTMGPDLPDGELFTQAIISPDYGFETFVTGPGNQLSHAAAEAVANHPGATYNPLFIHGGPGLGKTHLLQAIGQTVMRRHPHIAPCYVTCEMFVTQFLHCLQHDRMTDFRNHYRTRDLLIVDDIQFLAKRDRTQEEFFHTFNALHETNRQIILSADRPPADIPQLEERLVSRFQWGLVTQLDKPSFETRVAIVRSKIHQRGADVPDDVVQRIAERAHANVRELEGAITTLQGSAALRNRPIDAALADELLATADRHPPPPAVGLEDIITAVTRYYRVKTSDLHSKRRHKSIAGPRQVCMWLARKLTRMSLEEIGGYLGGRDHTTVMHAIKIIDRRRGQDPRLAQEVDHLAGALQQPPPAP